MVVRRLKSRPAFMSGDKVVLREFFHRDKGNFGIGYSLAQARLPVGGATLPHMLKTSEVYYILKGRGVMYAGRRSRRVGPGTAIHIAPNETQYIRNTGKVPLEFLCIVDPAWKKEDEEIL